MIPSAAVECTDVKFLTLENMRPDEILERLHFLQGKLWLAIFGTLKFLTEQRTINTDYSKPLKDQVKPALHLK
jgi:hypothetical protein